MFSVSSCISFDRIGIGIVVIPVECGLHDAGRATVGYLWWLLLLSEYTSHDVKASLSSIPVGSFSFRFVSFCIEWNSVAVVFQWGGDSV